ncbi:MAG: UDP-N-acetylmuramate dehydrogenase [Lachnospiraceae bacterium]|nr:UDP-N-acetylmuramate dehydrogenase [Lachnospiraceae bacterium]
MKNDYINELKKILTADRIIADAPLADYTSFKIGGKADVLVNPETPEDIREVYLFAKKNEIPLYVLGNGSNMLVSDEGFRGIILLIKDRQPEINIGETENPKQVSISVTAGCSLAKLAQEAAAQGLTGLEFAAGIPGTVGGAVVMNAGAYGGEIKDVLDFADCMDEDGEIFRLSNEECEFGYRSSVIQKKKYIVLYASFILERGDVSKIKAEIKELNERRREKQPLELPSAGSTFKRPEGKFAGKLIEDAGLKGYSVGAAQVSEKHCGFVVNRGGATAAEVYGLISDIIEKVYENSGVVLEPEVRLLGFDED